MHSTINCARELKLIEYFYPNFNHHHFNQMYDYLFVLDFEATCWEKTDPKKAQPEIIEFPVVLYDVRGQIILEEFQQYVKPTENSTLSNFCTELTGIQQNQVDDGISLEECLELFKDWVEFMRQEYGLRFYCDPLFSDSKQAMFVTWSDWDLGTCLRKECRRKSINKPGIFNRRIDLRTLYIELYNRHPQGLNGALTEVGLEFEGREHCGLDDARNTAKLARQMISDGILLKFTHK